MSNVTRSVLWSNPLIIIIHVGDEAGDLQRKREFPSGVEPACICSTFSGVSLNLQQQTKKTQRDLEKVPIVHMIACVLHAERCCWLKRSFTDSPEPSQLGSHRRRFIAKHNDTLRYRLSVASPTCLVAWQQIRLHTNTHNAGLWDGQALIWILISRLNTTSFSWVEVPDSDGRRERNWIPERDEIPLVLGSVSSDTSGLKTFRQHWHFHTQSSLRH